ncbi:MAG: hypothetical protein MJZ64_02885 [Paludibacteraceae bacterium]|nr:hypothetical protein [Paludibacteraceae bacterium]
MNKVILVFLLSISVGVFAQTDGASAPSAGFGSTSSMMGSGSAYSSSPSINAYGMAEAPMGEVASVPNEGRGAGHTPNPERPNTPIGDAVPFLLLLAAAYAVVALCRRKAVR